MNKRQVKKKEKRENRQIEIWGYPMSYRENKKMERKYREYCTKSYCAKNQL